jgi:Lon-like protease
MMLSLLSPPDPPPGVDPVRGPRGFKWIIIGGIFLIIIAASNWIPIPIFWAYQPGPVRDVEDLVKIDETETYSSEGRLMLTTVNVDIDVTLAEWVLALFDPDKTVVLKEDVTGGQSLQDLERQQRLEMDASKQHAIEVALSELGIATPKGDGARVVSILRNSPADGELETDDVIVEIDGKKASTTCDVGRLIDSVEIGTPIDVTIDRDGEERTYELTTGKNPQDPTTSYIGVAMEEVGYTFDPGFEIEFETGEIAGPSAGLMFSLALYDKLTPDDLTHGREIAGTGTIACDGGVGSIGGIEQKIAGAEAQGAEIFLAPAGNAQAAEQAADEIQVVSVSRFDDAVEYLEGLE